MVNASPIGTPIGMAEATDALTVLNSMLKDWQMGAPQIFRLRSGTVTLVDSTASYSLATDNPLRIYEMRYTYSDGRDLPMLRLTRTKYMRLPVKTTTGIPIQYYFDPQTTTNMLYVWLVPVNVTTEHLSYSYVRRFQVCTNLNDDIDVPESWDYTVSVNLAKRLLPTYGVGGEDAKRIDSEAGRTWLAAKTFERATHVQFGPSRRSRW
jgi:hypothetical protein